MAKGKKAKLFSGRDGRRDWDEVEEDVEYEEEESEDADEDEETEGRGARLLSSVGSFLRSRRSEADEDEDEEDDEEDEDEEEDERPRGAGLKGLFSRKKTVKKDDYDYDDAEEDEPAAEEESYSDESELYDAESYAEEGYADEDYVPQEYAEEDEYAPVEFVEDAEEQYVEEQYAEEDYDPEAYESEEAYEPETLFVGAEEVYEEQDEESDPFAALAYRAANPEADYEDYAEEYEEEAAPEEYQEYEEYAEDEGEYAEEYAEDEEYAEGEYEEEYDEPYDDFDEEEEEQPVRRKRASRASSGALSKYLFPALCVIALCALGAIAFAVATLLGSSAGKDESSATKKETEAVETAAPVDEESSDPTAGLTAAEIQAQGLATPNPSETISSVKAKLDEAGRIVPDVGGAVVPNRGTKLSLDDFSHSAMIGNSFVEGMKLWSDIDSMTYICADGVSLDNMIGNYLYYVTVQNYESIYLCLGLNEIGWGVDTFIDKYEKVIDYIRSDGTAKTQNATIYIVSVMPVEEIMETEPGESGSTISKSTIVEFNERLKQMCEEKGCWYLDVYSALADSNGYLPDNIAADDHVHFEKTGYSIWTNYLQTYYVDEGLLGE